MTIKNIIKNKYLLFLVFLILFLFCSNNIVHALEIKNYPAVPGLVTPSSDCTGKDCLSIYVAYWFGLLVYVAGILALISFTIGAVSLIASADNPETASNAKDRMRGAILGLVLTVASFIIIQTINPQFITPVLTPAPSVEGVYYTNGQEDKPCPIINSDTSTIPQGFNNIKYTCSGNGPTLLIWMFPNTGLEEGNSDLSQVVVQRVACNNQISISGGSFKMAFEQLGIYYYIGSDCSGYASDVINGDQNNIDSPFNGNIKSVRIVDDANTGYGIIFHAVKGLENGGECGYPLISDSTGNCQRIDNGFCCGVDISASSADVFVLNNQPGASGDGVAFYSEPYGWDTGANAGFENVPDNTITVPFLTGNPKAMCFDYTNVDRPDEYKYKCSDSSCGNSNSSCSRNSDCGVGQYCNTNTSLCACSSDSGCNIGETCDSDTGACLNANGAPVSPACSDNACETFQDCPGSIQIKGSYLVALYSPNNKECTSNNDCPSQEYCNSNGVCGANACRSDKDCQQNYYCNGAYLCSQASYCQTFNQDVENLNTEPFIASGARELKGVYIIPIK